MNKTRIEWAKNNDGSQGFSANPIRGKCLHECWYCYAEKIRIRFKKPEKVTFHPEVLEKIEKTKKPATIFMGSMHDIFGNWISHEWIERIIETTKRCPQHTFLFLTKNPDGYSYFDFPENCWLGVSSNGEERFLHNKFILKRNKKWISYEPLLPFIAGFPKMKIPCNISWIVIGGLTPKPQHKKEWVNYLATQARKINIPVFMKKNLRPVWDEELIQERPF